MNLAKLAMDGSSEGPIKWVYNQMYETVSAANNIIYHALRIPETERSAVQKRSLGEAYFMRAFTHYMIAYRYGRPDNGVPFVKYEDFTDYAKQINGIPTQQATVMDNYKLIVEDLQKAADNLDWFKDYSTDNYGRATKDAALGYMVKTYAFWAQHDKAQWSRFRLLSTRFRTKASVESIVLSTIFSICDIIVRNARDPVQFQNDCLQIGAVGELIGNSLFPLLCIK